MTEIEWMRKKKKALLTASMNIKKNEEILHFTFLLYAIISSVDIHTHTHTHTRHDSAVGIHVCTWNKKYVKNINN